MYMCFYSANCFSIQVVVAGFDRTSSLRPRLYLYTSDDDGQTPTLYVYCTDIQYTCMHVQGSLGSYFHCYNDEMFRVNELQSVDTPTQSTLDNRCI